MLLLFVLAFLIMVPLSVLADSNVVWDFSVPGDYDLFWAQDIEVDGTNAQLILQAQTIRYNSTTSFMDNTLEYMLSYTPDVSLKLAGVPGSYVAGSTYESRVLNRGNTPGFEWDILRARMTGANIIGTSASTPTNVLPGIYGMWKMDTNWSASVGSGLDGSVGGGNPAFMTDVRYGIAAGEFDGNDYVEVTNGMPGISAISISFWAYAYPGIDSQSLALPICLGNASDQETFVVRLGGAVEYLTRGYKKFNIGIWKNNDKLNMDGTQEYTFTEAEDAYVWRHIVVVYDDNASPRTKIYKDTVNMEIYQYRLSGNIDASTQIEFGRRVDGLWYWWGCLDEIIIFDRAITAAEVEKLYNIGSALRFRVRSSDNAGTIGAKPFVGPDGSPDNFYTGLGNLLATAGSFNRTNQYMQYQAEFFTDKNTQQTPLLESVTIMGSKSNFSDTAIYDFQQGSYSGITNYPTTASDPYLGIIKQPCGGYFTNAIYTSRVLDGGGTSADWKEISWTLGYDEQISSDTNITPGIVGLYHFNGVYDKDVYGAAKRTGGDSAWTHNAKLGQQSIVFDGVDDFIAYDYAVTTAVQSVEFWLDDSEVSDGVMELWSPDTNFTGPVTIFVTNRMLDVAGENPRRAAVYLNAVSSLKKLLPGWNHVAVVFDEPIAITNFNIGVADGDNMQGKMDELVLYNLGLSGTEINYHYQKQRKPVAGRVIGAKVRTANTLSALQSATFTGDSGLPGSYYDKDDDIDRVNRYLQYRLYLAGDGNGTPAIESVTVNYDLTAYQDDTAEEFVQGEFHDETAWYGTEMNLFSKAMISPVGIVDSSAEAVWHLDEATWTSGGAIVIDSEGGNDGTPLTPAGPDTAPLAAVGAYCGSFDGVNDNVSLPSISLDSDFSVSAWFKTTSTNQGAVISTEDAGGWYGVEVNRGSAGAVPGQVSFVINDSGTEVVTSYREGLNDGNWHNVVGLRSSGQMHIYIDGERTGTRTTAGSGSVGGPAQLGSTPVPNKYYEGYIDEVAVWDKALTEAEIGDYYCGGYITVGQGVYESRELQNAGDPSIWKTLSWVTDAPYNREMEPGEASLLGLWHFNNNYDEEVAGNDAQAGNGAPSFNASGRFNECLSLAAADDVLINYPDDFDPNPITVEAWVQMSAVNSRNVIQNHDGLDGYILGTDANGLPYFRVGNATVAGYIPVRVGKWTHLAGTFDNNTLKIFIDGENVGISTAGAKTTDTLVAPRVGDSNFAGLIDELAIWDSALCAEAILDHYRAGAVTLKFQAQTDAQAFVGSDGTAATYFTDSSGCNMEGLVNLGVDFKYKAYFATENYKLAPKLYGAEIYVANYPVSNPQVNPDASHDTYTPGRLLGFVDDIWRLDASALVEYQLSWNGGADWYYWHTGSNLWVEQAGNGYPNETSTELEVNNNIYSFYDQLVEPNKAGVELSFKAFLHSEGDYQIKVTNVLFNVCEGRIVLTAPNGTENGPDAWVQGAPEIITWYSEGNVSDDISIELWKGGAKVSDIGAGEKKTNSFTATMPDVAGNDYHIRIFDDNDTNIWDYGDGLFSLTNTFRLITPNGGEVWPLGTDRDIIWNSPAVAAGEAYIYFSDNEADPQSANWILFATNTAHSAGDRNTYTWHLPTNDHRFASEQARIGLNRNKFVVGVETPGDAWDISDNVFTNAGIVVTYPNSMGDVAVDALVTCKWKSAAASSLVDISFYAGQGATQTWASGVSNNTGWNEYADTLPAGTKPKAGAWFKVEGSTYSGFSEPFSLADIQLISPTGNISSVLREHLEIGTTQTIKWVSSSAGNQVDLSYSVNGGAYLPIPGASSYPQNDDGSVTNTFGPWTIPGPPSHEVRVQISSSTGTLSKVSDLISFYGVKIIEPNASQKIWQYADTNAMRWITEPNGRISLQVAYQDNPTDGDFEEIIAGNSSAATNYVSVGNGWLNQPAIKAYLRGVMTNADTLLPMYATSTVFSINGMSVVAPTNGAVYTMGSNVAGAVEWYSAGDGGGVDDAQIWYSRDNGASYTNLIATEDIGDGAWIPYDWTINRDIWPSDNAKIRVEGATYSDISDTFVLRGIRIINPNEDSVLDIGDAASIQWQHAGLDGSARLDLDYSADGTNGPFFRPPGLPFNVPKNTGLGGGAAWNIDADLDPSTNAMIRATVISPVQDTDVVVYSDPFVMRGVKVVSPDSSTNWTLGTAVKIQYMVAGFTTNDKASVYYSADGSTYDSVPVALDRPLSNTINEVAWNIENTMDLTREPSTSARIKIKISGEPDIISEPFTMRGIKVLKPSKQDVWANSDGTNYIAWRAVGAGPDFALGYTDWDHGPAVTNITPSFTGTNYGWTMPGVVGTNYMITVWDSSAGATGVSERFTIVAQPDVFFKSPQNGEFWKATETKRIEFTRAGVVSNDFVLNHWVDPFNVPMPNVPIKTGGFAVTNQNTFYVDWDPVPHNFLGRTMLIVTNSVMSSVRDVFTNFFIVGKFANLNILGNLYARNTVNVQWTTKGAVSAVDLYYSTNPDNTNSWTRINDAPVTDSIGHDQSKSYPWKLPDLGVTNVAMYIRVQDHTYSNTMYPNKDAFGDPYVGPFDQYGPFDVKYYRVFWEVYDGEITSEPGFDWSNPTNLAEATLHNLSMSDELGFSVAGIPVAGWEDRPITRSPYIRYYPHGEWDTLWFKEFFHDKAVLDWQPEEDLTNIVVMERSQIEPDYHVMANFTFDDNTTNFLMYSWLERGGQVTDGATNCTVKIYSGNGAWITNKVSNSPTNGIFWQNWNVTGEGYTPKDVFFARVEILFSGVKYSSGLTFMMRLAATSEEIGETVEVRSSLTYRPAETNFVIYSWLERAGAILDASSNCVFTVSESGGGTIGAPLVTNDHTDGIYEQIWNVPSGYTENDVFFGRTEIDYIGQTYSAGQTFMMRLEATDAITNMWEDVRGTRSDLASVSQNVDTVRGDTDWIRNTGIPGLQGDISGMSNRLDTAITDSKDDIIDAVVTNTARLGDISSGLSSITGEIVNVIGPAVTNIQDELEDVYTNIVTDTSRILTRPTTVEEGSTITILYKTRPNIPPANVTISIPAGPYNGTMDPVVAGLGIYEEDVAFSFGPGTYIVTCQDPYGTDSMIIECVATAADQTPGLIAGLSNMMDTVAADVDSLSGISALTNSIASLEAVVNNLTGLDVTSILTALDGVESDLQSVRSDSTSLQSSIASVESKVSSVEGKVSSVEGKVSSVESGVSSVESGMSTMENSLSEIKSAVNSLDMSSLDQLTTVVNQIGQIGSDSSTAAQNSQQAKTAAQEASTGIEDLKVALGAENVNESLEAIAGVREALMKAQNTINALSDTMDLGLSGRMNEMLEMLKELAESEGFAGLAEATGQALGEAGAGGGEADIGDLNKTLQETKGKIKHMEKLMEEAAYKPVITETLIGEK